MNYRLCLTQINISLFGLSAVAVQQLERQLLRERELTVEKNTALELEYRKTVEKLEQQLKSSESDRNLLMVAFELFYSAARL